MTNNPQLYNPIINDHYHAPRHHGVLPDPDIDIARSNESCGDTIHLTASIKDSKITGIKQEGNGCIISQAYASLLADNVLNKSIEHVMNIEEPAFIALAHMYLGPQRALCALLPLRTLKEGLRDHAQPQ